MAGGRDVKAPAAVLAGLLLLSACSRGRAEMMPTSYRMMIGPAINVWLMASGVGVRTAPAMKAPRIAYFRFFASIFGVTIPMRASSVIAIGTSKTRPNASVNFNRKSM